jgi:hypothetical protein
VEERLPAVAMHGEHAPQVSVQTDVPRYAQCGESLVRTGGKSVAATCCLLPSERCASLIQKRICSFFEILCAADATKEICFCVQTFKK